VDFPGPLHEGNGKLQPIIDERATPEQRQALFNIMSGKHSAPATAERGVEAYDFIQLLQAGGKELGLEEDVVSGRAVCEHGYLVADRVTDAWSFAAHFPASSAVEPDAPLAPLATGVHLPEEVPTTGLEVIEDYDLRLGELTEDDLSGWDVYDREDKHIGSVDRVGCAVTDGRLHAILVKDELKNSYWPLSFDEMARVGDAVLAAPRLAQDDLPHWFFRGRLDKAYPIPSGEGNLASLAAGCAPK
jgi:Protein of unknown function (DUF1326)